MIYTLEELKGKNFAELKKIGYELNVLPKGDRRRRESWIDAIVGVNLPLLARLEASPAGEVPAEYPMIETVENSPGVGVDPTQDVPLESKFGHIVYPKSAAKPIAQNEEAIPHLDRIQGAGVYNLGFHSTKSDRDSSGAKTETLGSQEGDRILAVSGDCETDRGRVLLDQSIKLVNFTKASRLENETRMSQSAIAQATENSPGVKVEQVEDLLPECCECFGDGYIEDEFGLLKYCSCNTAEPIRKKTQRAIAPGAKNSLNPKSDRNPILTGIPLSDRFLARYAPPQSETLHYELTDGYRADTDGQLSLFEVQVVTEPEPPDPDDFESLDAFREAIALWDAQNPEPPAVSLDSMCEWAPCPEEWYEPESENLPLKASSMIELSEQSEVLELLQVGESSDTLDFFIPTFGRLGDRSNRSDEPPDTGIFARLPKPKPPSFPPQSASWTQVGRKSAKVSNKLIRHP